ncbi:MAG: FtsK/SpoIIIE family [Actinomycetota bacterium]
MRKSNISKFWPALSLGKAPEPEKHAVEIVPDLATHSLPADNWHCLVLGAAGTGKTTLVRELLRSVSSQSIWLGGAAAEVEALKQVITRQERFEDGLLLVVDDAHLHTEQLELIELAARDGLKSNVRLVITSQLLSDLPQAVWRNCQLRYALGESAIEQLEWSESPLSEFQAAFRCPGRQGVFQLPKPVLFLSSAEDVAGNPLLRRASTPQLAPYEESAPTRQTPLGQWSKEEPTEQPGLRDHPRDSRDLPHRTRYSRTL